MMLSLLLCLHQYPTIERMNAAVSAFFKAAFADADLAVTTRQA
jgi:hypothetical protein